MKCYVDSSVVLRYLLTDSTDFQRVKEFDSIGSSELLRIECLRVLHRYRMSGSISDAGIREATVYFGEIFEGLSIFEINDHVKNRAAEAFPTVIGTLDAIHLSTAQLWANLDAEPLVIFTFDNQMRTCAQAMGMHVI